MLFDVKFVPHNLFKVKDWYVTNSKLWYYHTDKKNYLDLNEKFLLQTIDPLLKDIFILLQNKKIETYPSCQGHFYKKEKIRKIWDHIKNDEKKFHHGIVFTNVENGKKYFHINKNFYLPWHSFEEFSKEITKEMSKGYLALKLNFPIEIKNLNNKNIKLNFLKSTNTLEVWVLGSSYREQKKLWNTVKKFLSKELNL